MTNQYPGRCYVCGLDVPASEGVLYREPKSKKWLVRHTTGKTRGTGLCDNGQPAPTSFRTIRYPWQEQ